MAGGDDARWSFRQVEIRRSALWVLWPMTCGAGDLFRRLRLMLGTAWFYRPNWDAEFDLNYDFLP